MAINTLLSLLDYKLRYARLPQSFKEPLRFVRMQKSVTKIFKPLYRTNHYRIEIDITYNCNLKCLNCDRSCKQAESEERMSVEQLKKFIKESIEQKRKWEKIRITGGEPTLHPQILDIIQLLLSYKKNFSPETRIQLVTNGFGLKVKNVLRIIPSEIEIENTYKVSKFQYFDAFNIAPIDFLRYKYVDYLNACPVTQVCGIGLTRYGYYPCAVGGGIDRILGFDIGSKEMPFPKDLMIGEKRILCRYCGHYIFSLRNRFIKEEISSTWKRAYENYKIKKPVLSLY